MEENEQGKFGRIFRWLGVTVIVIAFLAAGVGLFWPNLEQKLFDLGVSWGRDSENKSNELLTVIFPDNPQSLSPFSLSLDQRQRLNSVYEPLVKLNPDLDAYSGLAVSWGMLDDLTWHFSLRKNVRFQDGSAFDAEDVVHSFELAKGQNSDLAPLLMPIAQVKKVDDFNIEITTSGVDPLLVQRVAKVFIVPSEWEEESYVGTGAYRIAKFEAGKVTELEQFLDYWGEKPFYKKVRVLAIADKSKRVNTFLTNTVDLLSFVSYDAAKIVEARGFELVAMPSLEVQFLLFNLKSDFFRKVEARKALNLAVDKAELVKSVGGYAKSVNQFVGSGVFGFDSEIKEFNLDLDGAKNLIAKAKLTNATLQLHLQKGLDAIGEHIRKQLEKIGVKVIVSYLEPVALQKNIETRAADVYFLGFKSDFADSMDLFAELFSDDSQKNIAGYQNEEFSLLLAQAQRELKPEVRLPYLKQAMKMITVKDIVGVPLFEYENLYGFKKELGFKPRIDGQIYFEEIN